MTASGTVLPLDRLMLRIKQAWILLFPAMGAGVVIFAAGGIAHSIHVHIICPNRTVWAELAASLLVIFMAFFVFPSAFFYRMLLRFPSSVKIDGDRLSVRLAFLAFGAPLDKIRVRRSWRSGRRSPFDATVWNEEILLIRIPWRGTVRVNVNDYSGTEILARLIPREEG